MFFIIIIVIAFVLLVIFSDNPTEPEKPNFNKTNNNQTPKPKQSTQTQGQKSTKQPSEKELADLFDLAIQAKRDGKFKLAISHYEKLKKLAPTLPSVYSSLAKVQILNENYNEAIENLTISTGRSIIFTALELEEKGENSFLQYRIRFFSQSGQESILAEYHNNCRHIGLAMGLLCNHKETEASVKDEFLDYLLKVMLEINPNLNKPTKAVFQKQIQLYHNLNLSRLQGKNNEDLKADFHQKYGETSEHRIDETYRFIGIILLLQKLDWEQIEQEIHTAILGQYDNGTEFLQLSNELDENIKKITSNKNTNSNTSSSRNNKTVTTVDGKISRNQPCPCGSKLKYKSCCGKLVVEI